MKWLRLHKSWLVPLGISLLAIAINRRWLTFDIVTSGDQQYGFNASLRSYLPISTWVSSYDFGSPSVLLWRAPADVLYGVFGLFGADLNAAIRPLLLWPTMLVGPLSMYYLLKHMKLSEIASSVGSLIYGYNAYFLTINTAGHLLLTLGAGWIPAAVLCYQRAIESLRYRWFVALALVLVLVGIIDLRILYIGIITLGLLFIVDIATRRINISFNLVKGFVLTGLVLVFMSSYWLLAAFLGGTGSDNYVLQRQLFGNNFWTLKDAITLHHPFWNGSLPVWFQTNTPALYLWLLPASALISTAVNRRKKLVYGFALVGIIGILLGKQVDEPFSTLYPWLFEHAPGFRGFREATKFYSMIALSYAVLAAFLVDWLVSIARKKTVMQIAVTLPILLICLPSLSTIKPIISGEIQSIHKKRSVPADYQKLYAFLDNQPDSFRTFWLPTYTRWRTSTPKQPSISAAEMLGTSWKQMANLDQTDSNLPIEEQLTAILHRPFADELFDFSSIKYVIVPIQDYKNDDNFFEYYGQSRDYFINTLNDIPFLKRISIGADELVIYENADYSPLVNVSAKPFIVDDFTELDQKYKVMKESDAKDTIFVSAPSEKKIETKRLKTIFNSINSYDDNAAFSTPNLIENGSFENGLWETPQSALCEGMQKQPIIRVNTERIHEGVQSLEIKPGDKACFGSILETLSKGEYWFRFSVLGTEAQRITISLNKDNSMGDETSLQVENFRIKTSNVWSDFQFKITVGDEPINTPSVFVTLGKNDDRIAQNTYFDSFSVIKVDENANDSYFATTNTEEISSLPKSAWFSTDHNTTKHILITNPKDRFLLTSADTYDENWKLYLTKTSPELEDCKKNTVRAADKTMTTCEYNNKSPARIAEIDPSLFNHVKIYGFANAWSLDTKAIKEKYKLAASSDLSIELYYAPQTNVMPGIIISTLAFVLSCAYIFGDIYLTKKRHTELAKPYKIARPLPKRRPILTKKKLRNFDKR